MTKQMDRKPMVRFKGFNKKWNKKKLGTICREFQSGSFIRASEITESGEYPVYGGNGLRGYTTSYNHDGLYALIGRQGALCGNMNLSLGKAFFTEHAIAVKADDQNNTLFLYYLLGIMNLGQYSGQSAQPGLAVKKLLELPAFVGDKNEQTEIAKYFKKLDSLIQLHTLKHAKLVTLKLAMLQKMFPQDGASIPEIRFKGFDGNWKKFKLGDISNFINGRAYSQDELLDKGRYKVLRVGNFYTNSSWYFSDMELAEKFYAVKGDLLYTWSASFGPHIWDGEKVIYHYHIWKVELSNKLNKEFALQLLDNDKERILSNSNGSTMIHITKEGMELKEVIIPEPEEQKKIGAYFCKLDELIANHAIQLEKLKQLKSACLAKMFV